MLFRSVSDVNGSFTIKGLVGEVSVKVAFEGNKVYAASSNIANFTFTEKTKIIAPSVNMVYGVGKYLIITLKDEQGNALINHNLIVRINGATVIKRTNNKECESAAGQFQRGGFQPGYRSGTPGRSDGGWAAR